MQYLRNAQSDFDPVFFYLFVFSSSVTYVKTEKMVFTPPPLALRGQGEPWDQIMKMSFNTYLIERGSYGGHLAEKFLNKYCSYLELLRLPCCNLVRLFRNKVF